MARKNDKVREVGGVAAARGFPGRWTVVVAGLLAVAGVMAAVTGDKMGAVVGTLIYGVFVVPVAGAAGMLGLWLTEVPARRGVFDGSPWPAGLRMVAAVALGLGAFALATLGLGTLHLIEPGGSAAGGGEGGNPWPLLVVPIGGMVAGWGATRRFFAESDRGIWTARPHRGEWLLVLAAGPVAALLIAATFPPGSLWSSEARGYDVLEYHLQLPREYALNNSTAPQAHNVYSYLPANVEMIYLLQMQLAKGAMGGDRDTGYLWGTYPAQFCHVMLMLLAAAAVGLCPIGGGGRPPRGAAASTTAGTAQGPVLDYAGSADAPRWFGATGRAMAVLLFLGIPWVLVTGSLAYNEAGMLLFGTLALGLALDGGGTAEARRWRAILAGVLLGLAVGCKMTAGVFFALPVAAIYLARGATDGRQWRHLLTATLLAVAAYLPWALRAAVYSGGNPVFPIAATILPRDGWTSEQAQRWAVGHAAPAAQRSATARLAALGQQSLLDAQWSVQPYPMIALLAGAEVPARESLPWWQRVGLLWLAVPLALAGAFVTRAARGDMWMLLLVLGVQVVAWMWLTQLEARFLLPAAVPLALLAGAGVQGLQARREAIPVAALRIVAGTVIALHACLVILALLSESGLLGGAMAPERRVAEVPPIGEVFERVINVAAWVKHPDGQVPTPSEKVLLIGEATPWRFIGDVDYFTTFDRHPFAAALGDPARGLAWLKAHGVRYVLVNWSEVKRLHDTYGFDPDVTREAMAALENAGLTDTHAGDAAGWQILRVGE